VSGFPKKNEKKFKIKKDGENICNKNVYLETSLCGSNNAKNAT
jgi:hypothetical protein